MDAASLLIVACALGVQSGWQPAAEVPDTYEFSIVVDPKSAVDLAAGKDVDLAIDVPEDLQRISRIRITAGDQQPIRRRRVTALKPPVPADIELTQAFEPAPAAGQRHAAGAAPQAFDPYATSPSSEQPFSGQFNAGVQQAATPVRDALERVDGRVRAALDDFGDRSRGLLQGATQPLAGQGLFRSDAPAASASHQWGPPWAPSPAQTSGVATGNASAWPAPSSGATASTPTPANPWAAQAAAAGTPTLAGDWRTNPEPFAARPAAADSGATPSWPGDARSPSPMSAAAGEPRQAYPNSSVLPSGVVPPGRDRVDQPIDPRDAGQWFGATQPAGTNSAAPSPAGGGGGRYGATASTNPSRPAGADQSAGHGQVNPNALAETQQQPQWPSGRASGPFGSSAGWPSDWPRLADSSASRTSAQPGRSPSDGSGGPAFPDLTYPDNASGRGAAESRTAADSNAPAVTKDMLAGVSSQPLEDDAALWPPRNSQPASPLGTTTSASTPAPQDSAATWPANGATPASSNPTTPPGGSNSASAFGWDAAAPGRAEQPVDATAPAADKDGSVIPVIVAWTLLFSSVAGNAYLLWSYLEVRTKYRSLVRRSGQGARSRFSAA